MKYFQIYRPNLTWELPKTEILRQDFGVFRFVSVVLRCELEHDIKYEFSILLFPKVTKDQLN